MQPSRLTFHYARVDINIREQIPLIIPCITGPVRRIERQPREVPAEEEAKVLELQIALDRIPLDRAVDIAGAVAAHVDWIEVGTSLIKQFGAVGLEAVVSAAGTTPVLADLKTVDDVRFELDLAYGAGARSATVLGLAPEVTVDLAVRVSGEHDRELVVDLMGLATSRIEGLAERLPHRVVLAPHVSKDAQGGLDRAADLLGPWATGRRIALAGGLTAADLPALRGWPDLRVIIGSAISQAVDPVAAVLDLREAARGAADADTEQNPTPDIPGEGQEP
jgi:3-hexulose-6-phosphate synthase